MATATKESKNGKVEASRADAYDFENGTAEDNAAEIIRRNWNKRSSTAESTHPFKCAGKCGSTVKKGQRFWRATSQKSAHRQCVVAHLPKDQKALVEQWDSEDVVVTRGRPKHTKAEPKVARRKKADKPVRHKKTKRAEASKKGTPPAVVRASAVAEPSLPLEVGEIQFEELSNMEANHKLGYLQGRVEENERWLAALPKLLAAARGEVK